MSNPTLEEKEIEVCPACGGELGTQFFKAEECVHGDTYVEYCIECDWRGDPE